MNSDPHRRRRFEAVAAEVYDPLQRYLRRRIPVDEAGDVLADVLLTIWRRLDDMPDAFALPWSYGVARRTLSNHRRSKQRHLRLMDRLAAEPEPAPPQDPADTLQDTRLAEALAGLHPLDQEILRLWAWEELEPREIAQVLGRTSNAVSLRLSRAKRKLAETLSRQDPAGFGQIGDETAEDQRR